MLMVETDTLKRPKRTPIYTVVFGTHKPHRDEGRSGDLDSNVAKVTGVKVLSITHTCENQLFYTKSYLRFRQARNRKPKPKISSTQQKLNLTSLLSDRSRLRSLISRSKKDKRSKAPTSRLSLEVTKGGRGRKPERRFS